ncbi:MAG: type III-B CRISPR module RAMP protein Cmr6 [Armatimonadota bacterium]|nr:type III-B CRISPR module RAMP protein Cmr6 [Armatimonadota bacterium]
MEVKAIRKPLESLSGGEHVGLMLNRYLSQHDDTHEGAKSLYRQAQGTCIPSVYSIAFQRWRQALKQLPNVHLFTATAVSSIAVGLGNESVLEAGLTVHHTYGVPVIPGSALKGLCRRGALRLMQEGKLRKEAFQVLFGYSEQSGEASAGYITFWDAWYDPDSVGGKPFHRDVITVHHQQYYGDGKEFPTDFDDPNPVPFLVVRPGARFLFAIQAPDEAWGKFTQNLLKWCLQNLGVGAKTNAGYGFLIPTKSEEKSDSSISTSTTAQAQRSQSTGERGLWQDVIVVYNPSQRNLQVQRQNQGKTEGAFADEARTRVLLATLPESARSRLTQGKRKLLADVEVEVSGNRRVIVKIVPKE